MAELRQIVRTCAEQMRRNAEHPDFDPDTAVRQLRQTADLIEAEGKAAEQSTAAEQVPAAPK